MRNKVKTVCEHDALRNGQVRKILLIRHVISKIKFTLLCTIQMDKTVVS